MALYLDLIAVSLISFASFLINLLSPELQSPLRIVLGLGVVLFIPGYLLTSLLFPGKDDIDPTERLALSLGLSIAIVPLIGLILNYTPMGIRLGPISLSLTLFNLITALLVMVRRSYCQTPFTEGIPRAALVRGGLLSVSVVGVVAGVIVLAAALRPQETFTEFYILGPEGRLEGYPTQLIPNQPYTLTFGIGNHENREMHYELRLPDHPDFHKEVTVAAGERWEEPVRLSAPVGRGRTRASFELYQAGESEPYRTLHLFIDLIVPDFQGLQSTD
jgi:uncharacterized membrane protein